MNVSTISPSSLALEVILAVHTEPGEVAGRDATTTVLFSFLATGKSFYPVYFHQGAGCQDLATPPGAVAVGSVKQPLRHGVAHQQGGQSRT